MRALYKFLSNLLDEFSFIIELAIQIYLSGIFIVSSVLAFVLVLLLLYLFTQKWRLQNWTEDDFEWKEIKSSIKNTKNYISLFGELFLRLLIPAIIIYFIYFVIF